MYSCRDNVDSTSNNPITKGTETPFYLILLQKKQKITSKGDTKQEKHKPIESVTTSISFVSFFCLNSLFTKPELERRARSSGNSFNFFVFTTPDNHKGFPALKEERRTRNAKSNFTKINVVSLEDRMEQPLLNLVTCLISNFVNNVPFNKSNSIIGRQYLWRNSLQKKLITIVWTLFQ